MSINTTGDFLVQRMKRLANAAHEKEGQTYGQMGYGYHLQQVAEEVGKVVRTDDSFYSIHQIVAYGHDLFEDTDVSAIELLDQGFSSLVIDAIHAITHQEGESRPAYLSRCMQNPIALRVKIADTLSNLTHSVRDGNRNLIARYTSQLNYLHNIT